MEFSRSFMEKHGKSDYQNYVRRLYEGSVENDTFMEILS